MSASSLFDLEKILQPISPDRPGGEDLRLDASPQSPYYRIKEARSTARANERKALSEGLSDYYNRDDWRPVLDLAPQILASRSKDLEVLAWLIEGLARTHGFVGLAVGFSLARQILEQYWETTFPEPDEEGIATCIAPIIGLNGSGGEGTLIMPIDSIPLTAGDTQGPFSQWQCQQAFEVERIASEEKRQQKIDSGYVSLKQVKTAAAETPGEFFIELNDEIEACIREYDALVSVIDQCCKEDPQPTSNIRQALAGCKETLRLIAEDVLNSAITLDLVPADTAVDTTQAVVVSAHATQARGPINSRQGALQALSDIADFFRRTEPHSPISYSLEQAVRWSRLTLPELLGELIPDRGARETFFKYTGIPETHD